MTPVPLIWFLNQTVSHKANFTSKKPQSKKHLVQKLRNEKVPPTMIMQISGHKNVLSVLNYSSITEDQQRKYSQILKSNNRAVYHPKSSSVPKMNPQIDQNTSTEDFNLQVSEASSLNQMNSMFLERLFTSRI